MKSIKIFVITWAVFFLAVSNLCFSTTAQAKFGDMFSIPESFTSLANRTSPSVVNIRTVKITKGNGPVFRYFFRGPKEREDPFEDFFNKFFGGDRPHEEFRQQSLGSGFIIDESGYIVTNNHVVENADKIRVILNDEREFDAEIVGLDKNTDIALIKIKPAANLPKATLGDSDELKVGQWVVAIGCPFGLEHTVTAGIVSAKGRVIGSGPYDDFIQTDASINPGNSGGPLINTDGDVVGINTAIISGGQGIGFAIPINLAKGIIRQLKEYGSVTRGWLGVSIQNLSRDMAKYYKMGSRKGVLIIDVFPGDPADKAGIKPQDIILDINGKKVESSRDLTRMVANIRVGDRVKIRLLRKGKVKTVNVKIAKRDDTRSAPAGDRLKRTEELGISISKLTPEIARRLNLQEAGKVVVVDVDPGSKGAEAGIRIGDIIIEINHMAIKSVKDYKKAIEKVKKDESIQMFIKRANAGFIIINLTK